MRIWFKDLRKKTGLSQGEFASLLNVSQQAVSLVEKGGRISVDMAKKIAEKLEINWTRFFED